MCSFSPKVFKFVWYVIFCTNYRHEKKLIMNKTILLLPFSLLVFTACQNHNKDEKKSQPPNIILINVDDMGWRDVGFMGSEYYETPNLDALAADGMIFTNAYASASNCAPSRACMMSGQWSPRHGIFTVGTPERIFTVGTPERGAGKDRKLIPVPNNTTLPDSIVTLTEAFKKAGYKTCIAGK